MRKSVLILLVLLVSVAMNIHGAVMPSPCGSPDSDKALNITTIAGMDLMVCNEEKQFSIELENTSKTQQSITDLDIKVLLPLGIKYFPNSASGATLTGADSSSGRQLLSFTVSTGLPLAFGNKITFTFKARANCEVLSSVSGSGQLAIRNETRACYKRTGSTSLFSVDEVEGSGSYNVLYPSLELSMTEAQKKQFGTKGEFLKKDLVITNSGFGSINMSKGVTVKITYPTSGTLSMKSITAASSGISGLTPTVQTSGNIITVTLTGNGSFDQNETIVLTDSSKVENCGSYGNLSDSTRYRVEWGCDNSVCNSSQNNASLSAYVNRPLTFSPSLKLQTTANANFSFCQGETSTVFVKWTNAGNPETNAIYPGGNKARNLELRWRTMTPIATKFSVNNIQIRTKTGSFVAVPSGVITGTSDYRIVTFYGLNSDPDGTDYGLEDLDHDGYYDDLAVGQTIEFKADVVMNGCPFNTSVPENMDQFFSQVLMTYSDACDYSSSQSEFIEISLYYRLFEQNINGATDMVSGKTEHYTFFINSNKGGADIVSAVCDDAQSFFSDITLPAGVVWDNTIPVTWNGTPLSGVTQTGNILHIPGGNFHGTYNVPLKLSCVSPGSFQESNIHWEMKHRCTGSIGSSACNCDHLLAKQDYEVFIHNNQCGTGGGAGCGIMTDSFTVARSSFGYYPSATGPIRTSDLTNANKVNASTPNILLDRGLEYDTVTIKVVGHMNSSSSINNAHVRLTYKLDEGTSENIFEVVGVNAFITRSGSPISLSATNTFPKDFTVLGDKFINDLDLNLSPVSGSIQNNDIIEVIALVRIKKNNLSPGYHPVKRLRGEYWWKSGINAPNDTVSCESFGGSFTFIKKEVSVATWENAYDGCTMFRRARINMNGGSHDDFLNEVRPLAAIQTFTFTLPENTQYVPNSTLYRSATWEGPISDQGIVSSTGNLTTVSTASNPVTLTWTRQGDWPVTDENYYEIFDFYLKSPCNPGPSIYTDQLPSPVTFAYKDYVYAPGATVLYTNKKTDNYELDIRNIRVDNELSFSADAVQQAFSQTVVWPVYICNVGSTTPNVWLRLKPLSSNKGTIKIEKITGSSGNTIAFESCSTCATPGTYLVKVGELVNNQCTELNITASYSGCAENWTDVLEVLGSWNCDGYPGLSSLDSPTCTDPQSPYSYSTFSGQLKLEYWTAGLAMKIDVDNPEIELCDEVSYTVSLKGDKFADVNNIDFSLNLPEGVEPIFENSSFGFFEYKNSNIISSNMPEVEYANNRIGSKNYKKYSWQLFPGFNSINSNIPKELPGSRVNSDLNTTNDNSNEIKLYFKVRTTCPDFDQGIPLIFAATGKTNCNSPLNPIQERKIRRKNFNPDSLKINLQVLNGSTFTSCKSAVKMTVKATNERAGDTKFNNKIKVVLPPGVAYVSGANNVINDLPLEGHTTLEWTISSGLAHSESNSFDFEVRLADNTIGDTVIIDASSEIKTENVVCGEQETSCALSTTTGQYTLKVPVIVNAPIVTVEPSVPMPICRDEQVTLNTIVTFAVGTSPYNCQWEGPGFSSSSCNPVIAPVSDGQYTVTVTDVNNCKGIAYVDVILKSNAFIDLVNGGGVSCPGRSDGFITIVPRIYSGATSVNVRLLKGTTLIASADVAPDNSYTFYNLSEELYTFEFTDPITGCVARRSSGVGSWAPKIFDLCASNISCNQSTGTSNFRFRAERQYAFSSPYTYRILNSAGVAMSNSSGTSTFTTNYSVNESVFIPSIQKDQFYIVELTDPEKSCVIKDSVKVKALKFEVHPDSVIDLCYKNELRDIPVSVTNNETCINLPSITYKYDLYRLDTATSNYVQVGSQKTTSAKSVLYEDLGINKYKAVVQMTTASFEACSTESYFELKGKSTFTVDVVTEAAKCYGTATGRAWAKVNGGYGSISYQWIRKTDGEVISNTSEADGLSGGAIYAVVVKDEYGCDPYYHEFTMPADPDSLRKPVITDLPDCDASATAEGGTSPYRFYWYKILDPQTDQKILVFNEKPAGNVSVATGLRSGLYRVVVIDANGCTNFNERQIDQPEFPLTYNICMGWATRSTIIIDTVPPPPKIEFPEPWVYTDVLDEKINECVTKQVKIAEEEYKKLCLNANTVNDQLDLEYNIGYEHFTLYYYDRGGNLVKTVPPKGVHPLATADRTQTPAHELVTTYEYNSLGQLTKQNTPGGGTTNFIYNDKGQLRFSQNARQTAEGKFSYTNYDELGRTVEVGESSGASLGSLDASTGYSSTHSRQNTYTVYSDGYGDIHYKGQPQRNLRNRVSYSYVYNSDSSIAYSFYSYDPHGNVEWVVQKTEGIGENTISYKYDLISNKVLEVVYNEGRKDQLLHRYSYDEDNRITNVQTSRDGIIWDNDAGYSYYKHGPLKRMAIGEDNIQGLDYAYTLHGWLKGINSPDLSRTEEAGLDGGGPPGTRTCPDAFGMSLNYYDGDYVVPGSSHHSLKIPGTGNLYNGNISGWSDKIGYSQEGSKYSDQLTGFRYTYDKLNRIRKAEFGTNNGTSWTMHDGGGEYYSDYTYDANGNILSLKRNAYNDAGKLQMDNLAYNYTSGTNRLSHVHENVTGGHNGTLGDITDQSLDNYTYDGTGNLTRDNAEKISIRWNVYGKITEVLPDQATPQKPHLKFTYDASGNRVSKYVNITPVFTGGVADESQANPVDVKITYYVRDASGNIMAVYERSHEATSVTNYYKAIWKVTEMPLYGSSRLGQISKEEVIGEKLFHKKDFNSLLLETDNLMRVTVLKNNSTVTMNRDQHTGSGGAKTLIYNSSVYPNDVSFSGKAGNNIAIAEEGKTGALDFYTVTAQYWGKDHTTLAYDRNGKLMKGAGYIRSDRKAKNVIVNKPGTENYYIFARDTVGSLRYYLVDVAAQGYGTVSSPVGEITDTGKVISGTYGRHMAVVEDYVKNQSIVFVTSHNPATHKTTLYRIVSDESGVNEPEKLTEYSSYDKNGDGELQITPNGKRLLIYNHKEQLGFFDHREAEVLTFGLTGDHKVSESVRNLTAVQSYTYPYGNHPKGSLEAGKTSEWMYVNQTALVNFSGSDNKITRKVPLVTNNTIQGCTLTYGIRGDLRRDSKDSIYVAVSGSKGFDKWADSLFCITARRTITISDTLRGYMPYQPHRIYPIEHKEQLLTRNVGFKQYELTDHLGNVRVVVGDVKAQGTLLQDAARILAYNNFYAFGMTMPGRTFNSNVYRYGYNGMEKDDEIKGSGNSYDFDSRIYDPRIGRWLSMDPRATAYESPYAAMNNNPVLMVDPDGEWAEVSIKKFYRNKKGDLIQMKKVSFRRVAYKEIDVKIHNAKLLNISDRKLSNDALKKSAKFIEENITKDFTGDREIDQATKREVSVKVTFVGGITPVNDISEVNLTGYKAKGPDDLFLVMGSKNSQKQEEKNARGSGFIILMPGTAHFNWAEFDTPEVARISNNGDLHEFIHRGGQSEHDEGVMTDDDYSRATFKHKWNLFQGAWNNNSIKSAAEGAILEQKKLENPKSKKSKR